MASLASSHSFVHGLGVRVTPWVAKSLIGPCVNVVDADAGLVMFASAGVVDVDVDAFHVRSSTRSRWIVGRSELSMVNCRNLGIDVLLMETR